MGMSRDRDKLHAKSPSNTNEVLRTDRVPTSPPSFRKFYLNMIARAEWRRIPCTFKKRSGRDYKKFQEIMGPIPLTMEKPTVGRFDHTKGYVFDRSKKRWNFRWQEHRENSINSAGKNQMKAGTHAFLRQTMCPHCGLLGPIGPIAVHTNRCHNATR